MAENEKRHAPYRHGTVKELVENTESVFEINSAGGGLRKISPQAKRLVEVRFIPDNDTSYLVGIVEKWSPDFDLWIVVNNGSSERPDWKHHHVAKTHNLGWRLINLDQD